jgi:CrcB protein
MAAASVFVQGCAVAVGAAAGALARWGVGLAFNPLWVGFPLGTLVVNCVGGLLIGVAIVVFAQAPNDLARLLAVTGFLGGFTTFSSFSAESLSLLQRGHAGLALLHSTTHLLGALGCAWLGHEVAGWAWRHWS